MKMHLTLADKLKIEQQCRASYNFSDGGYWQGFGKEPNCGAKEHLTN